MPAIWKAQLWPLDWKTSVFIPVPKKGNAKECSNYHTTALISDASKVSSKFSKLGFNSTRTKNLQMSKLHLEKAEETEIKLPTCTAAATAESLQSCPTLCDPVDGSPPGSPVPGILQARTLEWVAISFSNTNMHWIIVKARKFQKSIYFCFIDYAKAFDCVDHNKLWKILKEMGIPDHLTCLLRNLYAGQEATVRTKHGTRDWFQIGK